MMANRSSGRAARRWATWAGLAVAAAGAGPATRPAVTVRVDTSAAPQLAELGERVRAVATDQYPMICRVLASPGFTAADRVSVVFKDIDPPAYTVGTEVTCKTQWFVDHPDDVGCVVHELAHVVQHYTIGDRPGWLVEGIADWVRWFNYEPVAARPHPNPDKAKYDDSYRTTAAFLDWCQVKYNKHLVLRLNEACRKGHYRTALWQELTGRSLTSLGAEWVAALKAERAAKHAGG